MSDTAIAREADGAALSHRPASRETALHADDTWSGALSCVCGWHVRTEQQRARQAVSRTLERAWRYHTGSVGHTH